MTNQHGDFIWYELMTSDADAAAAFYAKVGGWTASSAGQPGMDYRFFSSGDGSDTKDGVGGFMAITPDMAAGGARPAWIGYICVDDVDASVAKLTAAGGAVLTPANDLPGVGRMAMVADPQGTPFHVMKGAVEGGESHSFAALEPKVGHCAWNELSSADPEVAKSFYGSLFGWVKDGDMEMGPLGKYEFWKDAGGRFALGAVMPLMPGMPMSAWTFYFRVGDIDAALATIKAEGGQMLQEPTPIPGGDFSLTALDPQGAAFGLVGPRK